MGRQERLPITRAARLTVFMFGASLIFFLIIRRLPAMLDATAGSAPPEYIERKVERPGPSSGGISSFVVVGEAAAKTIEDAPAPGSTDAATARSSVVNVAAAPLTAHYDGDRGNSAFDDRDAGSGDGEAVGYGSEGDRSRGDNVYNSGSGQRYSGGSSHGDAAFDGSALDGSDGGDSAGTIDNHGYPSRDQASGARTGGGYGADLFGEAGDADSTGRHGGDDAAVFGATGSDDDGSGELRGVGREQYGSGSSRKSGHGGDGRDGSGGDRGYASGGGGVETDEGSFFSGDGVAALTAASVAPEAEDATFRCPYKALGLQWMRPEAEGEDPLERAMRDGPCGRIDQDTYRNRTDYHYLVIGVQKAGLASLTLRLDAHLQSAMPRKETGFFLNAAVDTMLPEVAKQKYGQLHWGAYDAAPGTRRGEVTPNYQTLRQVAPRVQRVLGAPLRFLMLVRDPVRRAYDFYLSATAAGRSWPRQAGTFEEAFQTEYGLIQRCGERHGWKLLWYRDCYLSALPWGGMLGQGMYYEHLMLWQHQFPPCSVMVLDMRDLDAKGVDSCLFAFLDLRPYDFEPPEDVRAAAAAELMEEERYSRENPMSPATEQLLRDFYRPHIDKFEAIVDRQFHWF